MPDAFDVLELPPVFGLSAAQVRAAYLAKVSSPPPPGADPEAYAAGLNAAKAVLQDAESRANLLLERLGGPPKDAHRELPEGFLLTVLEAREGLEEASAAGNAERIESFRRWADAQRTALIGSVGASLERAQRAAGGPEPVGPLLSSIRKDLNAWRYIERMLEQIDALG